MAKSDSSIVRTIFIVLLVIFIVVIGFLFSIEQAVANKLGDATIELIEEATDGKAKIKDLKVHLFPKPKVVLKKMVITYPDDPSFDKVPAFSIGKVKAELNLLSLMQKKFIVNKFIVSDVSYRYEVNYEGKSNWSALFPSTTVCTDTLDDTTLTIVDTTSIDSLNESTDTLSSTYTSDSTTYEDDVMSQFFREMEIRIENILWKEIKIEYVNKKERQFYKCDNISNSFNFTYDGPNDKYELRNALTLKGIKIKDETRGTAIEDYSAALNLHFSGTVEDPVFNLHDYSMQINKSKFTMTAKATKTRKEYKIRTTPMSVEEIAYACAAFSDEALQGFSSDATVSLSMDVIEGESDSDFSASGELLIDGTYLHYHELPQKIQDISLQTTLKDETIHLKKCRLKAGNDSISCTLKLDDFKKPHYDIMLKGDLNLANLKEWFKVPEGTRISGLLSADYKASGTIEKETKRRGAITIKDYLYYAKDSLHEKVSHKRFDLRPYLVDLLKEIKEESPLSDKETKKKS